MDIFKYAGYAGKIADVYAMFSIKIARNAALFLLAAMALIMYAARAQELNGGEIGVAPIALTFLWGFFVFQWGAEFLGGRAALMAVFLFAFSPVILARIDTGGIAAAFGLFAAVMFFLRSLKENSRKNCVTAGIAFGIAYALLPSAALLLIYFFPLLALLWALAHRHPRHAWRERAKEIIVPLLGVMCIFAIGWFAVALPLRQLSIYYYFPVQNEGAMETAAAYWVKVPLALHALSIAALFILGARMRDGAQRFSSLAKHLRARAGEFLLEHFTRIACAVFILFYAMAFGTTIVPVLPFIFLLVSSVIVNYLRQKPQFAMEFSFEGMKKIAAFYKCKAFRYAILFAMLAWYLISVLAHYPYFASYTNESADILQKNQKL